MLSIENNDDINCIFFSLLIREKNNEFNGTLYVLVKNKKCYR